MIAARVSSKTGSVGLSPRGSTLDGHNLSDLYPGGIKKERIAEMPVDK